MIDIFGNDTHDWVGMPEFIQEKQTPYAQVIVRFDTKEDLEEFGRLTNQKLNAKTKSIWFPFKSHWGLVRRVYKND